MSNTFVDNNKSNNEVGELQVLENIHLQNIDKEVFELNNQEISYYDDFKSLLNNCQFCYDEVEVFNIDSVEDFSKYQHFILTGYYIAIDFTDTNLIIVTEDKKAFNLDISKIPIEKYSIIFKVQLPRKICLNSKDIYKRNLKYTNSIYDISHILNMFYGIKESNLFEFISLFMNNANNDIYKLLYNLHLVKNEVNTVISKHNLFSLVNSEFKLLKLIASCEMNGLPFAMDEYQEFINDIKYRYEKNEELLRETYQADYFNKDQIIKHLIDNNEIPILNESYLQNTNNSSLFGIAAVKNLYDRYNNNNYKYSDNRLYLNIDPFDSFGNVKSNLTLQAVHYPYIKTNKDKYFVIGSYPNLFYRVLANFSNIDYLIVWLKNNSLESSLAEILFPNDYKNNKKLYEFYSISFLNGFIQGYFNPEDMKNYFFEDLDFYMDLENVKNIANIFASVCGEILDYIYDFNKTISRDKRYSLSDNMSIYKFVKLTEADIFKFALSLIDDSLSSFNKRRKYNINIIGIDNNIFILEADEGAFNIAFDIVNRNLTKAYNKYIKNIPALCNVRTSHKSIKG